MHVNATLDTKSYCTTHQAAKLLGVSLRTIQLWAKSGLLPCWKTGGGHRRIPRDAIDRMLAEWRSAEMSANGMPMPEKKPRQVRILIADDDQDLLRLYRLQITRWEMTPEVLTVKNGIEALVKLGFDKPDVLIADLNMPEMDGFQMLRILRSMREMDEVEIVVVSALTEAEINEKGGLPAGISYLPKPLSFAALEILIGEFAVKAGRVAAASAVKSDRALPVK